MGFDALGKGVEEGKAPEAHGATKYLSKGLTRSRTDNLVVMRGGAAAITANDDSARWRREGDGALGAHVGDSVEGAVALKVAEPERDLSPTEKLEAQQWSKAGLSRSGRAIQGRAPRGSEG
jgi:ribonucleoside-diphosphate reductase alpha chain